MSDGADAVKAMSGREIHQRLREGERVHLPQMLWRSRLRGAAGLLSGRLTFMGVRERTFSAGTFNCTVVTFEPPSVEPDAGGGGHPT
jgi:hypothetical protein